MKIDFKEPIYEFYPDDDVNAVPLIYKIKDECEFKLASPIYPVILDPTRRLENINNFHMFERSEIQMYHMSFVRRNMRMKLENVSNKGNYSEAEGFLKRFERWTPEQGILHPHPVIGKLFREIKIVDNIFKIDLNQQCRVCSKSQQTMRCAHCKKVRYCGKECQSLDWPRHKK